MDTTQLNATMLKVMVLTSGLIGVSGQLRMKPENVAAVVGTKVVLQCQGPTDDPNAFLYWYEYIQNVSRKTTVSTKDTITAGVPNYDLYSISGDHAKAQYHLNINVSFVSGGRYQCFEPSGPHEPYAHITVLQSAPVCSDTIELGVVEEGETITYTCEVIYNSTSIDWPPVMAWTGPDGTITDVNKLSTSGGTVTSSVDVTGAPGLNGAVYSVRTHFEAYGEQPSLPPDHATNVPMYSHTHSFGILDIQYNPRRINFSSDENCHVPGSAIECRADGNPSPMYRWRNLVDNSTQYGPMLNITRSMLDSERSFSCEAFNIIRGTERAVSKNIYFTVSDASCSSGGLSVGEKIGIGVAAGVIGVACVAVVVYVVVKKMK